jgi:hypothetical protein
MPRYHEVGDLVRIPQCRLINEHAVRHITKPTPALVLGNAKDLMPHSCWRDDDCAVLIDGETWVVDELYIQEWR